MGKPASPADPRRSLGRARKGLSDGPFARPLRAAGAELEPVTTALVGITTVISPRSSAAVRSDGQQLGRFANDGPRETEMSPFIRQAAYCSKERDLLR